MKLQEHVAFRIDEVSGAMIMVWVLGHGVTQKKLLLECVEAVDTRKTKWDLTFIVSTNYSCFLTKERTKLSENN